jgi:hypothetical protein
MLMAIIARFGFLIRLAQLHILLEQHLPTVSISSKSFTLIYGRRHLLLHK